MSVSVKTLQQLQESIAQHEDALSAAETSAAAASAHNTASEVLPIPFPATLQSVNAAFLAQQCATFARLTEAAEAAAKRAEAATTGAAARKAEAAVASGVETRRRRVEDTLRPFFADPITQGLPLPLRIAFLTMCGYPRGELEDAMQDVPELQSEYAALLAWEPGTALPDPAAAKREARAAAAQAAAHNASGASAGRGAGAAPLASSGAAADATLRGSAVAGTVQRCAEGYWRVGAMVYAFRGDRTYFPVPLLGFDHSRVHDVLQVAHQLPSGEYGPPQFMAPGFKGVVPDEFPTLEAVVPGMQCIALVPDGYRGQAKEATILVVHEPGEEVDDASAEQADRIARRRAEDPLYEDDASRFTVDIEWSHDQTVSKDVDYRDIRLLSHPEVIRQERRARAAMLAEARLGAPGQAPAGDELGDSSAYALRGAEDDGGERVVSTGTFPVSGEALARVAAKRAAIAAAAADGKNGRARATGTAFRAVKALHASSVQDALLPLLVTHLRNFAAFPDLDSSDFEPPRMRTGTEFVAEYGEVSGAEGSRLLPIRTSSEAEGTGVGFGFNTASYPRHTRSHHHLLVNPIVHVARQCISTGRKFVDPDFPPSYYSIYGPAVLEGTPMTDTHTHITPLVHPSQRHRIVMRRLSEIFYRPRLHVVGSQPNQLKPGAFTPAWLESVVASLARTDEFESCVSPQDDGWIYGAYAVRVLVEGAWHFVLVDDFVPCDARTGAPLCMLSGVPNEIYTCLLEKALAKLEGSYAALHGWQNAGRLTPSRVWTDLTGSISEEVLHDLPRPQLLRPKDALHAPMREVGVNEHDYEYQCMARYKRDLCDNLHGMLNEEASEVALHSVSRERDEALALHAASGTRWNEENTKELLHCGFELGAWWHLDAAIRYWHPPQPREFGFHLTRGDYAGGDMHDVERLRALQLRRFADPNIVAELPEVASAPYSFWTQQEDYFSLFSRTLCLRLLRNFHRASLQATFAGRAAGPKTDDAEKVAAFLENPQIFVSFVQPTEVFIEVELLDRRLRGGGVEPALPNAFDGSTLQLHLLRGRPVEKPLTTANMPLVVVAASQPSRVSDDADCQRHPVTRVRAVLSAGSYVVIPCIGGESTERFVVKVFSTSAFHMTRLN